MTKLVFATCFINLAVPSTARAGRRQASVSSNDQAPPPLVPSPPELSTPCLRLHCPDHPSSSPSSLLGLGTLSLSGESSFDLDTSTVADRGRGLVAALVVSRSIVAVVVIDLPPTTGRSSRSAQGRAVGAALAGTVVRLLAWNLAAEVLFSLTIWTVLRRVRREVDLVDTVIINEAVALFAGLVPSPARRRDRGASPPASSPSAYLRSRLLRRALLPDLHLLPASDLRVPLHELAPTRGPPVIGGSP